MLYLLPGNKQLQHTHTHTRGSNHSFIRDKTQLNGGVCLFQCKLYTDTLGFTILHFDVPTPTSSNYLTDVVSGESFTAARPVCLRGSKSHKFCFQSLGRIRRKTSWTSCCYSNPFWLGSIATGTVHQSDLWQNKTCSLEMLWMERYM